MSLRPLGRRKPGVPSREEMHLSMKIRSIELGGGNPDELESLQEALHRATMIREAGEWSDTYSLRLLSVRSELMRRKQKQPKSPVNWLVEGF